MKKETVAAIVFIIGAICLSVGLCMLSVPAYLICLGTLACLAAGAALKS